jgi:hypothetical protein
MPRTGDATAATVLGRHLDRLEPRDHGFARSLLNTPFPSLTQRAWIEKLALRALPRPIQKIKHAERIFALFDHAAKHLNSPGITLGSEFPVRVELQRDVLKVSNAFGRRREREWYGDLRRDGTFDPLTDESENVVAVLRIFAKDPIRMARDHGFRTGYCCFCCLALTDEERSVALGYGPICAKHWGLPWVRIAKIPSRTPLKLEIKRAPRIKQFSQEAPIPTADRQRTAEFPYRLTTEPRKQGKIVVQLPANWLIIPSPWETDITTRLAAFLDELGMRREGAWQQLRVQYTAPSGRRSKRDWRLFVVHVSGGVAETLAQFPGEIA